MIKLKEGEQYFVKNWKDKEVIIPNKLQNRIYDIIRDESSDGHSNIRDMYMKSYKHEIRSIVDFIMSEIADMIHDEEYLIRAIKQTPEEE